MTLTPQAVTKVFYHCLFQEGEMPPKEFVEAEGLTTKVGFHPGRLEASKGEIATFLGELPKEFTEGWSFLNACVDKDGNLWTGEQRVVEQLLLLGLATGNVKMCAPKEFWSMFPGGVPYFQVVL